MAGLSVLMACGGSASDVNNGAGNNAGEQNAQTNGAANGDGINGDTNGGTNGKPFVPETEEFLVRNVATTEKFVFVPNGSDEGTTVARINGLDLSVTPIPVGLRPTDVVAFENPDVGAVAFVLVEGTSSVAVIRADAQADEPIDLVNLLDVPSEVNRLAASPDNRHVVAYIDPDRPFPDDSSVASLQSAALLRLGDTPEGDVAYDISLSRLIRDVEFTDDGSELYVVGQEGVNRLRLGDVEEDLFVPPLPLELSSDVFPPTDLEVEVAGDGSFLVVRSSAFEGVALYETEEELGERVLVEMPGIPTDIDLNVTNEGRIVLATIRDEDAIALVDVDAALAATDTEPYAPEVIDVGGANPGLAQITPDQTNALLYSTLPLIPSLAVFGFEDESVRTYPLRNQIRSVAISPDSSTAVVVHTPQPTDDPEREFSFFQQNEGLTIFDVATGYRRPITLQATPIDTIMTTTEERGYVFVLLESESGERQGVLRVDLASYRSDFVPVAREPRQIGLVAGKVFVSQESDVGRITFVDVQDLTQRTVSGYELNAGID
jgi:hypothetical protein